MRIRDRTTYIVLKRGFLFCIKWLSNKLFKRLVRWLYFRFFVDEKELGERYLLTFIPKDMRGSNPHFFLNCISANARRKGLRLCVNMTGEAYSVMLIREKGKHV